MKLRVLLVAVLVYVALDLSLPAMPGAFVFEVGDSVDGAQGGRSRLVTGPAVVPAMPGRPPTLSEPGVDLPRRLPPPSRVAWHACAERPWLPRAACAPAPVSEDPH